MNDILMLDSFIEINQDRLQNGKIDQIYIVNDDGQLKSFKIFFDAKKVQQVIDILDQLIDELKKENYHAKQLKFL